MKYDLLHIQGKPYVLMPLHDYREMVSGGKKHNLPNDILNALVAREENPVKILRKHRGMTQKDLAQAAAISRPYLAEIETEKKDGSVRAIKSIAEALNVDMSLLV